MDIEIIKGHVSRDHVHIMVSVPPYISVSEMMKRIKGRTSRKLLDEYKGLKKAFWGNIFGLAGTLQRLPGMLPMR
jgi:putative transposase